MAFEAVRHVPNGHLRAQNPCLRTRAAGHHGALSVTLWDLSPTIEKLFYDHAFTNDSGLHILGDIGGCGYVARLD